MNRKKTEFMRMAANCESIIAKGLVDGLVMWAGMKDGEPVIYRFQNIAFLEEDDDEAGLLH